MDVETALEGVSKFWRERCREESLLNRAGVPSTNTTDVFCPHTRIYKLCKTNSSVKKFLRSQERRLMSLIECAHQAGSDVSMLKYQRGTYLEFLGNKFDAIHEYKGALELIDDQINADKDTHALSERSRKRDVILSCLLRLEMEEDMKRRRLQFKLMPYLDAPLAVDRIPFGSITYSEFLDRYAHCSKPVIFTGASEHMLSKHFEWTLEGIASSALGSCQVIPKVRHPESCAWAQHEQLPSMTMSEFIARMTLHGNKLGNKLKSNSDNILRRQEDGSTSMSTADDDFSHEYLVDWSIPQNCPQILQDVDANRPGIIRLPALCSMDWLQSTPPSTIYRDSWPSLFIGPTGSSSGLHIDAFGSNFWMLLVSGNKKWTFFLETDLPNLCPTYPFSFDPVFPPDILNHTPARSYETVLAAGELLFVPANSPHSVINQTSTIAISGNYVDESNISSCIDALGRDGLTCPRSKKLQHALKQLEEDHENRIEFRRRGDSRATFSWTEFKDTIHAQSFPSKNSRSNDSSDSRNVLVVKKVKR